MPHENLAGRAGQGGPAGLAGLCAAGVGWPAAGDAGPAPAACPATRPQPLSTAAAATAASARPASVRGGPVVTPAQHTDSPLPAAAERRRVRLPAALTVARGGE